MWLLTWHKLELTRDPGFIEGLGLEVVKALDRVDRELLGPEALLRRLLGRQRHLVAILKNFLNKETTYQKFYGATMIMLPRD